MAAKYQIDKVVEMLKDNPQTRQAAISIYDGKEIDTYRNDTPCTYAVQFTVLTINLICLSICVLMISGTVSATISISLHHYKN